MLDYQALCSEPRRWVPSFRFGKARFFYVCESANNEDMINDS